MPGSSSTTNKRDFAVTRWTLVLAGAGSGSAGRRALEELAQIYWFPLYAFARRSGAGAHEAEDLVQELFAGLLAHQSLARVDRDKGRFRSYLLASLRHVMSDQRDRAQATKRGGGQRIVSLDARDAGARYYQEPAHDLTPQRLFERRWALALLDQVLARLADEYRTRGQAALFEAVRPQLTGSGDAAPHAKVAVDLGVTVGAVKVAAHRLRRRYRDLLRQEIAQTVADPADIDDEIQHLMNCL